MIDETVKPFAIVKYGDGYRLFTGVKVNDKYTAVGVDVKIIDKGIEVNSVTTVIGYNTGKNEEVIYRSKKQPLIKRCFWRGSIPLHILPTKGATGTEPAV